MKKMRYSRFVFLVSILSVTACTTITATPPDEPTTTPPGLTATPNGNLPNMPNKPTPLDLPFNDCPPGGNGGDQEQNLLKNRSDEGDYVPVDFNAIAKLTWPVTVQQKERKNWSPADKATIAQYEGIPVIVKGYLAGSKASGAESANCDQTTADMVDWHIWFVENPGESRAISMVIEPTPRSRANHTWTLTKLKPIIDAQIPVRVSGWLFFDPEHPDQLGLTRGTLWEIHPVMQIDVWQNGHWVSLDTAIVQ